jgi:hypothetical protein
MRNVAVDSHSRREPRCLTGNEVSGELRGHAVYVEHILAVFSV